VKVETNADGRALRNNPKGLEERTYTEVQAHDFSLTPRPAYASTSVAMRSITDELAIERLVKDPERLLELLRAAQEEEPEEVPAQEEPAEEAEPPHSEPDPPAEPDAVEASRSTQTPVHDYLADETEEAWRL
jgi:hypothetical protein